MLLRYWAEATQAWFDATVRSDVNEGVNCRARLQAHDPALALLLRHAYGDGAWRFTHCVKPATRDKWRQLQAVAGAHAATKAMKARAEGGGAAAEMARPGAAEMAPPTTEEEEERQLAVAIAQSLEG